jgi:S1-C subfamily serine protease
MKKVPRYSSSGRPTQSPRGPDSVPDVQARAAAPETPPRAAQTANRTWLRGLYGKNERVMLFSLGGAFALSALLLKGFFTDPPVQLTQSDIDSAVQHTLENMPSGPAEEAIAFEVIRPSVVRVQRMDGEGDQQTTEDAGTGVIIVDDGTILTSLHVVVGAERIGVVFSNGLETTAEVVSIKPEQDLAVLKARQLPDDITPATLSSSRDLHPGDRVVAVGFPFGIGPSASSGVISGLRREYRNPEGERVLSNLIQFDAAANPGNSGGPLITMDGRVVGIVTAILNPSSQRVFIGIGFAVPIETASAAAGSSPF